MSNVLIDTDVILDFFFDRKPFSVHTAQFLTLCETKQLNGFITPVTCSNLYYLLRRSASHEKVIDKLQLLLSILDVLVMDKQIVYLALNSGLPDFEGAMQNFSAIGNGQIESIVTRNTKDYKTSSNGTSTPENYLKTLRLNSK